MVGIFSSHLNIELRVNLMIYFGNRNPKKNIKNELEQKKQIGGKNKKKPLIPKGPYSSSIP
jgi:hypothetical protein